MSFYWRGKRRLDIPGLRVVEPRRSHSVNVSRSTMARLARYAVRQGVPIKAVVDALFADLPLTRSRNALAHAGARFGVRTGNGRS